MIKGNKIINYNLSSSWVAFSYGWASLWGLPIWTPIISFRLLLMKRWACFFLFGYVDFKGLSLCAHSKQPVIGVFKNISIFINGTTKTPN
ncbi:hypothetical protein Lal_00040972 [Lupinus albus]|nr:hypothetical protein Lal_00040972 [Lupinus albus]